nr:Hypothetical_protein [Citrobacter werkmanii]CAD0189369.1 Hypothetical_protein [Citrobacter werkmanii]
MAFKASHIAFNFSFGLFQYSSVAVLKNTVRPMCWPAIAGFAGIKLEPNGGIEDKLGDFRNGDLVFVFLLFGVDDIAVIHVEIEPQAVNCVDCHNRIPSEDVVDDWDAATFYLLIQGAETTVINDVEFTRHGGAMEVGELFSAKDENRGSRGDGHAGSFSAIAANRKGDYPIRAGGQEIGENRMKGFIRLIAEYVGQCLHDAPRDLVLCCTDTSTTRARQVTKAIRRVLSE